MSRPRWYREISWKWLHTFKTTSSAFVPSPLRWLDGASGDSFVLIITRKIILMVESCSDTNGHLENLPKGPIGVLNIWFAHGRQCSKKFVIRRQKSELLSDGSLAYLFVNQHISSGTARPVCRWRVGANDKFIPTATERRIPWAAIFALKRNSTTTTVKKRSILAVIRFQFIFCAMIVFSKFELPMNLLEDDFTTFSPLKTLFWELPGKEFLINV